MQMRRSTMRRLHHSLAFTVVVTLLLAAQLRLGTYSRPSLLDGSTTSTTKSPRSDDGGDGPNATAAAAVGSSVYSFLVHSALVLSSLALTVLQCYRRAVERGGGGGGAAGGPPGMRWNGSKWVVDDVPTIIKGGFGGGAAGAPAGAGGGGLGGLSGGLGQQHPPSAYPPGPSAYVNSGYGTGAMGTTGGGHHQGYQGAESPEEARRRFERERMEAEYWARIEREDEEREAREERERERKAAAKSAKKQAKREEREAAEERERERAKKDAAKNTSSSSSKGSGGSKKWERFEERWAELENNASVAASIGAPLRYDDIPWPPKMSQLLHHAASAAGGGAGDASSSTAARHAAAQSQPPSGSREMKLAYHRCIRRWHPDKFAAKFKRRLDAGGESDKVMERINAVARALTTEFAKHS